MVALPGNVNICNECVDLAAEIVHEDGEVRIAPNDLEALRKQAREAGYFRHWLDMVRDAVERADKRLAEIAAPPTFDGEAEYASWAIPYGVQVSTPQEPSPSQSGERRTGVGG